MFKKLSSFLSKLLSRIKMGITKIRPEQIMGIVDGWIPVYDTWAYASATTITVPGGATANFSYSGIHIPLVYYISHVISCISKLKHR